MLVFFYFLEIFLLVILQLRLRETFLSVQFVWKEISIILIVFVSGSRWKVKDLSYKISKYPAKLKRSDVDKEIQRAFDVWSEYTDLTFTPKSGQVHIEIRFERGEHGDGDPFDGPGGTLAHAYFPVSRNKKSSFLHNLLEHCSLLCVYSFEYHY